MKFNVQLHIQFVAFGMGLDKPDIRLIIHYGAPKEMETYIQGAGRAGRDGNPGRCVIFYSTEDFSEIRDIVLKNIRKKSSEIINYRTDQHRPLVVTSSVLFLELKWMHHS